MNNPLEAVTQAVNSLVTALKLPDESAKANEVLGEMSFPQFSRLLPYRDYNQESGLFMNDTTMGFMLEAIPINGANESIVEALDHMLRTKLPRGVPFCIHLMSSQLVGDRIEYGLREFSCREIITPFLARRLFPDVLCLSSGCAGRSGAVTGVVSLAARG